MIQALNKRCANSQLIDMYSSDDFNDYHCLTFFYHIPYVSVLTCNYTVRYIAGSFNSFGLF